MPRSMPTRRRWFISSPSVVSVPPARPQERRTLTATVPRKTRPTAAPTHVLQPGPASTGRATSLIRGIRGRAGCGNQIERGQTLTGPPPERFSTPPPGPAGMTMQPWDLSPVVDPTAPVSLNKLDQPTDNLTHRHLPHHPPTARADPVCAHARRPPDGPVASQPEEEAASSHAERITVSEAAGSVGLDPDHTSPVRISDVPQWTGRDRGDAYKGTSYPKWEQIARNTAVCAL